MTIPRGGVRIYLHLKQVVPAGESACDTAGISAGFGQTIRDRSSGASAFTSKHAWQKALFFPGPAAAGNMLTGPKPGGETTRLHFTYDGLGRQIHRAQPGLVSGWHVRDYYHNRAWQMLELRRKTTTAKQRYTYYRCAQVQYRHHPVRPAWVPEPVIESQIVAMLKKLVLPEDVCHWAMTYLTRIQKKDAADARQELQNLRRRASQAQAVLDALVLKAAQAEDSLAEGSMRLARQRQAELALLQDRTEQVKASKRPDRRKAAQILELAQSLSGRFVTLQSAQKRQIVDSVFLNFRLDHVNLLADYRLPFSILAENGYRPPNSGRLASVRTVC